MMVEGRKGRVPNEAARERVHEQLREDPEVREKVRRFKEGQPGTDETRDFLLGLEGEELDQAITELGLPLLTDEQAQQLIGDIEERDEQGGTNG